MKALQGPQPQPSNPPRPVFELGPKLLVFELLTGCFFSDSSKHRSFFWVRSFRSWSFLLPSKSEERLPGFQLQLRVSGWRLEALPVLLFAEDSTLSWGLLLIVIMIMSNIAIFVLFLSLLLLLLSGLQYLWGVYEGTCTPNVGSTY